MCVAESELKRAGLLGASRLCPATARSWQISLKFAQLDLGSMG